MATGSAVFGSCAGEIDVSVKPKNAAIFPCCGWEYLRFILGKKSCSILAAEVGMVPGIGGRFGRFGLIEELKSPCGGRGFGGNRFLLS